MPYETLGNAMVSKFFNTGAPTRTKFQHSQGTAGRSGEPPNVELLNPNVIAHLTGRCKLTAAKHTILM